MDILGIGPLELIFILIIALVILGPKDMVKAGKTIGKLLRQVVTSPTWRAITRTSSELRTLPNKLIRDAGLEDDFRKIQDATREAIPSDLTSDLEHWQQDIDPWTTPPQEDKESGDSETSDENSTSPPEKSEGEQS